MTKAPKPRTNKEVVADLEKATPLVNECMTKVYSYLRQEKSDAWEQCCLFREIMSLFLLVHFKSMDKEQITPEIIDEYGKIIIHQTKAFLKSYDKAASTGSVQIH